MYLKKTSIFILSFRMIYKDFVFYYRKYFLKILNIFHLYIYFDYSYYKND